MEGLYRKIIFYYKEFISRNLRGSRVLIWFILTYLIYALMLMVSIPKVMSFAGDMQIFNILPFGYNEEYAMKLLYALGNEGRRVYLYQQILIDLFFPFLFAFGNCLLTGFLLKKLNYLKGGFIYLCLFPVFASWFDYLENIGVMAMLLRFPDVSVTLIQVSSFFSVAKSLLITIFFVVLFVLLFLISKKFLLTKYHD